MLTNEYVYVKTLQSVYIVMKVVRTVQGRNKLLKHRWCIAIQMCCIKDLLYLSLWHWISLLENVLYGAAVTSETRCHCLSTIPVSSYFIFIFWEICICTCICLSIYLDCRILLNIAVSHGVGKKDVHFFEGINHKAAKGVISWMCRFKWKHLTKKNKKIKKYSCYPGIPQWV